MNAQQAKIKARDAVGRAAGKRLPLRAENDAAPIVMLTKSELRELVEDAVVSALADFEAGKAPAAELVSGREMARLLGVSRTSMHRLRLEGAPAVRVGDAHRFRPAAVLAWLENRSAGGTR